MPFVYYCVVKELTQQQQVFCLDLKNIVYSHYSLPNGFSAATPVNILSLAVNTTTSRQTKTDQLQRLCRFVTVRLPFQMALKCDM